MAKKKEILGFITKEPKEWLHYVLLTALLILFYYLSGVHEVYRSFWIVFGLFLVLSIADQIIHKLLKIK